MRRKYPLLLEREEPEEPLLNLTPLIDVVFVLLITFLLISPMLNVDHVELATAGVLSKTDTVQTPITITLRGDDTIWFQGVKVTMSDLARSLKSEKARSPQSFPQLIADKNSHFGLYQEIKNLFEECGFLQMDVVLQ